MKTVLLSLCITLFSLSSVVAQWTIDPANPTIVCDATGVQSDVQSIADGAGGVYTFWYDSRTGNSLWDVYGQHYNAEGAALWEANGREFINYEGRISVFSFVRNNDGSMIFTWAVNNSTVTTDNGVYARKVDGNLNNLWEDDIKLFDATSYPNSLASATIVKSLNTYYVSMHGTQIGGSYTLRLIKIDADGNLLWPYNGSTVTGMSGFGSYDLSSDNNGGVYLYHSTGNGSGAGLKCMLIAGGGAIQNLWAAWHTVTTGTSGLSYQYSGIGDADGITFVWIGGGEPSGTGNNIYARRVLASNGLLGWNEATKNICVANGNQDRFFWKKSGSNYYITWADGRPGVVGNAAVYAQKFTVNGIILWEEDGVQVADLNTYIPHPKFDLDQNNTICITHKANTGFVAHKVDNNGNVTWGLAGVMVFSNNYSPFYEDYNVVYSEDKFIVIGSNNNNIYMNKIHPAPVQLSESASACNTYTTYGETYTSSGVYTIQYHPDTILTLNLTIIQNHAEVDVDGLVLTAVNDGGFQWYNCDTEQPIEGAEGPVFTATASGSYALQLTNGVCVDMSECIEITIAGVDDINGASFISIYPNPSDGLLNIDLSKLNFVPLYVEIFNMFGQVVYSERVLNNGNLTINTSALSAGTYTLQLKNNDASIRQHWIKK